MSEFVLAIPVALVILFLIWKIWRYLNRRLEEAFVEWSNTTGQMKWKVIAIFSQIILLLLVLAIVPGIALFGGGWKSVGDFVHYKNGDVGMLIYGHWNLSPAMANYYLMGDVVLGLPLLMIVFSVIVEPAMFLAGGYRYFPFVGPFGRWVAPPSRRRSR